MSDDDLGALCIQLDQITKDLEYLATEGVSAALSKDELTLFAERAASVRLFVTNLKVPAPLISIR
jgi:hypothetical protein